MKLLSFFVCLSASTLLACAGPLTPAPLPDETPAPAQDPSTFLFPAPIKQIAAGQAASYVLLGDGSVWGFSLITQPAQMPEDKAPFYGVQDRTPIPMQGLADVESIAFRYRHGCALHKDGTVSCWGDNRYGQLGIGTRTSTPVPTKVPGLSKVKQVDVGEGHTCVLFDDGKVSCFGQRTAFFPLNPLKDGEVLDKTPFLLKNLAPMDSLSLSRLHTCGTTTSGEVLCWGNLWPDDTTIDITLSEQLAYRDFRLNEAPADLLHGSCALQKDGGLACACQNEEGGVLGTFLPCYRPEEAVSSFGAEMIQADMKMGQACGLFADGSVQCKGAYESQIDGLLPFVYENWETIQGLTAPSALSVGIDACAIDDDCVRCWGFLSGRAPVTIGCYEKPPEVPH